LAVTSACANPLPEQASADHPDLIGIGVFSVVIIATVPYSIAVSGLRCPFLCDFFIAVRLLRR
jgi:hypothetical protein